MPNRILVVDDVADACEVLARLLRTCGFEVATACDGATALDSLDGFAPDVVILDLNMPVLDGYGFLERVRKLPKWRDVHVIVFSADHNLDEARLRRLGVVKFCRKAHTPYESLVSQVRDCCRDPGRRTRTVLVVDDHHGLAAAVAAVVSSCGHEAVVVHDGPAALAVLRSRPVALMVLDNCMPSMSGLDVLRSLWSDGEFKGPPVVMFSASDDVEREALRLGAVAFVSKADAAGLLGVLAEHVTATQTR